MDLSIVVISFNTRALLETCLSSVQSQVRAERTEIIVVDNASDDGSANLVAEQFPQAKLIQNTKNLGFARAVNQAIQASSGRYVLLLNSDATMLTGSAQRMIDHMDASPRTGAVGGMLLNPNGSFQGSYADFPTLAAEILLLTGLSRWFLPPTFPSHAEQESRLERSVDWVCGAFMMLRRETLDDIGLLDEQYFMYAEEVDWCHRARRAGWIVKYLPDAQAVHLVGGSYTRAPLRRRTQIYRSKWLYLRKNHGQLTATVFRRVVQAGSAAKLLAWAVSGVVPDPAYRERARRNVASYRHLLSHF